MGFADPLNFATAEADIVPAMLAEYGAITRRHLQRYLPRGEPEDYLYGLLADYPGRGGKMLRSTLCMAAARATGATLEDAIPSAVSIEILHNALLVHDDIQDASDERRGNPTLHAIHGVPLALNAGDAMGLLSLRPLFDNFTHLGPVTALRILSETEQVAWQSTEGQALELGWKHDNRTDLRDEDYLGMVLQKTCWLGTIHPLRVGCLIGARGRLPLEPLIRLGFFFGAAFQIQDDVLNLEPGPAYGKEVNGDLFEGKRTLMIIHALRLASERDRQKLVRFLGTERAKRNAGDVAWVRSLLERTRALEHAKTVARSLAGAALHEFDEYFARIPASRDLSFLRAVLIWVLRRAH